MAQTEMASCPEQQSEKRVAPSRRSTIKELLAQKAKRLRTEAVQLEALSDALPERLAGPALDEFFSEIVAQGLYK